MRQEMVERSTELGKSSAVYMKVIMENRNKTSLQELAKVNAQYINRELEVSEEDLKLLAESLHLILSSPQNYEPRILPNLRTDTVHLGEVYVCYNDRVASTITPELQREIELVSNFADILTSMDIAYAGYMTRIYAASKNGYIIRLDSESVGADNGNIFVPAENFVASYEPKDRDWYKAAINAEEPPVYTDIYLGTKGDPCVTCATPYYDANGEFAGVVALDLQLETLYEQFVSAEVGQTGFCFALSRNGEVIFSSALKGTLKPDIEHKDLRKNPEPLLADAARQMTEGQSGVTQVTVDDKNYFLAFHPMESIGWSFGALIEIEEVTAPAQKSYDEIRIAFAKFVDSLQSIFSKLMTTAIVIVPLLFALLFFASAGVSKRFSQPILKLSDGVREIASGNLDKKIDIHTGDEIEHLAVCFNAMTDDLKNYMDNLSKVSAYKERVATELEVARNIQLGMLPKTFPAFPDRKEFDIFADMHPAKEVGGDLYDFYLLDENHLVVTVADVSGKGVPAAMFMAISKTILKNYAMTMSNPEDFAAVMTCANNQLCQNNEEMMFVTTFLGMLDLTTGKFIYVNGGHNPPLVYSKERGSFKYLPIVHTTAVPLGLDEDAEYEQETLTLGKGDIIFMYTDGVTEAMNAEGELYSEKRLEDILNAIDPSAPLEEIISAVSEDIKKHAGETEQSDDITMLALKFNA